MPVTAFDHAERLVTNRKFGKEIAISLGRQVTAGNEL
jgi:hypothetical protein